MYMAITHLTNELYKAKDNNQSTVGIFPDLSKAFHTVKEMKSVKRSPMINNILAHLEIRSDVQNPELPL